uniref:Stress up-regulated Nod 19 protein n=1 Tax=Anthurium amnicola TaxID=1678845 RepID=A0A1D1XWV1_9ARAE
MSYSSQSWLLATMVAAITIHSSLPAKAIGNSLKTAVYLSPPFILGPGSVVNKFYQDIDFPRGHIALKSFNAEVVDEAGNPIPLHETYLHHWVVVKYYALKESKLPAKTIGWENSLPKAIPARNAGICEGTLSQYYGLGSETRRTATWVPDPYGIEVGNPEDAPYGYEEKWMLNVHAIDTRGAVDHLGCTECKCDLYNVTVDEFGQPLRKDYTGGFLCCYDQAQCRVKEGFNDVHRKLYLRYTVKWLDWDDHIVPVKIYILDVTDSGQMPKGTSGGPLHSSCKVEYEVEYCGLEGTTGDSCIDNKRTKLVMPHGGDIIYGVAHQHTGGLGSALYGQDGRMLCSSMPTYGEGEEAGNEAGYVVGMSTCYPGPGIAKIADGEIVTLESNYSGAQMHTGVMGVFYILVAENQPSKFQSIVSAIEGGLMQSNYSWVLILIVMTVAFAIVAGYWHKTEREGYQSLAM